MNLSDNFKGAIYMSFAMAGFGFNDMLVKATTEHLATGQIIFIRGIFTTLLVMLLAHRTSAFRPVKDFFSPLLGFRVLMEVVGTFTYIYALGQLPLANAGAILQFLPLAVTLGAALVLREPVGWRRWLAIGTGFLGVLLIIKPGPDGFSVASFLALGCVIASAARDLATRRLPPGLPTALVTLSTSFAVTISAGILIQPLGGWRPVGLVPFIELVAAAGFLLIGYQALISAMRIGEISFIAPFRYTYMVWSLVLSFTIFGDRPDVFMLVGSLIVVLSGIYTFYRENLRKSELLAQTAAPPAS